MPPLGDGPARALSGVNVAYERGVLAGCRGVWQEAFYENEVHDALRASGHGLRRIGRARVSSHLALPLREAAAHLFRGGRRFGSYRRATLARALRALLPVAALALPALLTWRVGPRGGRAAAAAAGRHGPRPALHRRPELRVGGGRGPRLPAGRACPAGRGPRGPPLTCASGSTPAAGRTAAASAGSRASCVDPHGGRAPAARVHAGRGPGHRRAVPPARRARRLEVVATREQPTRAASAGGARSPMDLLRMARAAAGCPPTSSSSPPSTRTTRCCGACPRSSPSTT